MMNSGIFSKAISNIVEAKTDQKSEGFTMVNVRPGEKVSAMLDVVSHLNGKSPSAVIAVALSAKIADFAASSKNNAQAILDASEKAIIESSYPHADSALGLLQKHGFLKIRNSFARDFDKFPLFSKKSENHDEEG